MEVMCEVCGRANRAKAMFCAGCLKQLPAFVATGPSALELMRGMAPARHDAPGGVEPFRDDPRLPRASGDARKQGIALVLAALFLVAGFMGWHAYVTRGVRWPTASAVQTPGPTPTSPLATNSLIAPRPVVADVEADAAPDALAAAPKGPPAQLRVAPPVTALQASREGSQVETVATFYGALSKGDGTRAAAVVTPAKRGTTAYDEASLSRFYRSLEEPLSVRSIRQIGGNLVEARYTYRATRTRCEATARIELEVLQQQTFIRRIQANC